MYLHSRFLLFHLATIASFILTSELSIASPSAIISTKVAQTSEEKNSPEEAELLEIIKAGNQGDAGAQCTLGVMYLKGHGVAQNYDKAIEWFQKAADQEDMLGKYLLGLVHTGQEETIARRLDFEK